MITEKYLEFEIEYGYDEKWHGNLDDEEVAASEKLSSLKELLSKFHKQKESFPRVQVFIFDHGWDSDNKFEIVTLTSITDEGGKWIIKSGGRREKLRKSEDIYARTPENMDKIREHKSIQREIMLLEKKCESIVKSLKTITKENVNEYAKPKEVSAKAANSTSDNSTEKQAEIV